ncbi:MAG: hypothetical protein Q8L88_02105 [Bacteroidota bacterium]|nr:hypothetical protein [Bacteroidota bacterium]
MEFFKSLTVWQKRGIAAVFGGAGGYAYYYYIGCISGTCAITSNPYISTMYGMAIAALLVNSPKKKEPENNNGTNNITTDQSARQ